LISRRRRRIQLRKKLLVAASVAGAAFAVAGAAYAAVTVSFSASVKPSKAGKPTALNVSILSSDPAAPQPPIMNRIVIKLDGSAKFNPSKFKRCKLNSLQAKGPKGCPSGSKIGTGTGIGMAKPVVTDPVNATLTLFNGSRTGGKDTVYVYVFPDLGPTFVTVGKISKSGGKYVLDFSVPPIKTLPSAPDASVVSVKTKTPIKRVKKGTKRYYLIVAPKRCKGSWKGSGTFYFRTGEQVRVPVSQKCKK
jgi:hypothetical protein